MNELSNELSNDVASEGTIVDGELASIDSTVEAARDRRTGGAASRLMRVIAFFDPAEPGFAGRMLKLMGGLLLLIVLIIGGSLVALARLELGRYFIVYMLTQTGQYEAALPRAQALVQDFPTGSWHYYRMLAIDLRRLGRYEESLAVYDRAVAAMPDQWWAHSHRCFYNALLGDASTALDSCDRSIELDPPLVGLAHDRRGFARALTGDRAGAIEDLEIALAEWADGEGGYARAQIQARREWLAALRRGEDPITPDVVEWERRFY